MKGIPRQAVLKPSHAVYRLQNQHFELGDRVTMVQDSGGVPLSVKGVVVGMNAKSMDVVWDVPFLSGTTLGDRCAQYRGSTVEFTSCLNLTKPQFIASTNPNSPTVQRPSQPFRPRIGPQQGSSFQPGPQISIMSNPNRGRGRGRGGSAWAHGQQNQANSNNAPSNGHQAGTNGRGGAPASPEGPPSAPRLLTRGGAPNHGPPAPPRGGFVNFRGRGNFHQEGFGGGRGRGGGFARGVYRGRGRGQQASAVDS